jgi:tRNA threonylcarbamoyladenosine biosynthesis protein TsaB
MISLGICTVTRDISICLYENDVILSELNLYREKIDDLILLINIVLSYSNKTINDVNELVVINGPGSYGGIRTSLTCLKTLSFIKKIPLKAINLLELLAYQHKYYSGLIIVTIESRKNEINYGIFGGGKEELNTVVLSDTVYKDCLFNKLRNIKENFLVVGDLEEEIDFNNGIYCRAKPLASQAILLAKKYSGTELEMVSPIYSYPVNINTSKKKTKNVRNTRNKK